MLLTLWLDLTCSYDDLDDWKPLSDDMCPALIQHPIQLKPPTGRSHAVPVECILCCRERRPRSNPCHSHHQGAKEAATAASSARTARAAGFDSTWLGYVFGRLVTIKGPCPHQHPRSRFPILCKCWAPMPSCSQPKQRLSSRLKWTCDRLSCLCLYAVIRAGPPR